MKPERVTIPLRLPADLHARLKALAEQDGRSLNAFIARQLVRVALSPASPVAAPVAAPMVAQKPVTGQPFQPKVAKARPNEPCPCGSGTKYKRCHGRAK